MCLYKQQHLYFVRFENLTKSGEHTYIATIHLPFSCSTLKYAYITFSMLHINKLIGIGLVAQNLPLICPYKVLHIIYFIHMYMYMCIIIIIIMQLRTIRAGWYYNFSAQYII